MGLNKKHLNAAELQEFLDEKKILPADPMTPYIVKAELDVDGDGRMVKILFCTKKFSFCTKRVPLVFHVFAPKLFFFRTNLVFFLHQNNFFLHQMISVIVSDSAPNLF